MAASARLAILAASIALVSSAGVASATTWAARVAPAGSAEVQARAVPSAPGNVTAACTAPLNAPQITVTWTAVSHASIVIYQSTTSATSGFSAVAYGLIGTTWTSGNLTAGHYWFEAAAVMGFYWTGTPSAATGRSTINTGSPYCVQP